MPSFHANRAVVVLAFPGVLLLDVAGPAQVFHAARPAQGPGYSVTLVSQHGGVVLSDTGIGLATIPWSAVTAIDTLIVPGGNTVWEAAGEPALLAWLQAAQATARRTASVCMGAFLLGAAGLLDGRRAVTHWLHCERLQADYPDATVVTDSIFVRDGAVWSSAGVSAGIDLALAMVEDDLGHHVALDVAQRMVVFLKRPGGQAQFSQTLAAQSAATGRFDALHAWMAENLAADLRVERLADRAGMSPRSFSRIYAAQRRMPPAKAVEAMRLEAARRMLETQPQIPVATVATRCGFVDDERLRRAFIRGLGVAPRDYRARFA